MVKESAVSCFIKALISQNKFEENEKNTSSKVWFSLNRSRKYNL